MNCSLRRIVFWIGASLVAATPTALGQALEVEGARRPQPKAAVRIEAVPVAPAGDQPFVINFNRLMPFNGNVNALASQLARWYRPALREEYLLLRNVCGLNKDERGQLAREGVGALRAYCRRQAEVAKVRRVFRITDFPSPRKEIQQALAEAAGRLLSSDRAACYRREVRLREDDRKRAVARYNVAQLDAEVWLNSEQREAIGRALEARLDDATMAQLEQSPSRPGMLPRLTTSTSDVFQALTPSQREFLRTIPPELPGTLTTTRAIALPVGEVPEIEELDEAEKAEDAAAPSP